MPQEAKERRPLRPREEESFFVDPKRIGETLGWKNSEIDENAIQETWWFKGPTFNLQVTKTITGFFSIGFYQSLEQEVLSVHLTGIKAIEFNKTLQTVRFKTTSGRLKIKGDGQVDGDAGLHISPKATKH